MQEVGGAEDRAVGRASLTRIAMTICRSEK
jgi:hypothetical protein